MAEKILRDLTANITARRYKSGKFAGNNKIKNEKRNKTTSF